MGFYTECYGQAPPSQSDGVDCKSEELCFVVDYSSRGNTLEGQPSIVSSAGECQAACQKNSGCAYWTWYGAPDEEIPNACFLKSRANDTFTLQLGAVSGPGLAQRARSAASPPFSSGL